MPKYRKMLSDWNAPYIQSIVKIIEQQSKITLLNWVLKYAEEYLIPLWIERRKEDKRPQKAILFAYKWRDGEVKLPEAKTHILACHEAAREVENDPIALATARAIGQSCSTIHSARHCVGLVLYGALAIAYHQCGIDEDFTVIEKQAEIEVKKMENALLEIAIENEQNIAIKDWKC